MATNDRHSYVEFYPSDWQGGQGYLPPLCEWVCLQVCLYNWDQNAPMPAKQLALRLARLPDWRDYLDQLLDSGKLHQTASGGIFHQRALASARKAFDLWEKKSRGGKVGSKITNEINKLRKSHGEGDASNENENENENDILGSNEPRVAVGDLLFQPPSDAWAEWRAHRHEIGHPMTERAEAKQIKDLESLVDQGHDPKDVINYSIMMGYRGLFPRKAENGRSKPGGSNDGFLGAIIESQGRRNSE